MNKPKKVYAFIDSQNLNLGVQSQGWKIDYRKLRLYLRNKYNVTEAFMFIGMIDGNQALYDSLTKAGFQLVFKQTVQYFENGKKTVKGNVDAELVLYAAARKFSEYDKAIIISGDGDFACLHDYLEENNKLLHIMVPNAKFSKLLKNRLKYIVRIDLLKSKLEYKSNKNRLVRSVETLGRAGKSSRSSGRSKP